MNSLYHLISEDFIHALGWTVVHSLWQAIVIALIMMLVLFFLQKKSSNARYWAANIALIVVLMTAIWTFFSFFEQPNQASEESFMLLFNQETAVFLMETGQLSFVDYYSQKFTEYFNEHLPLIVMIWGIGVAFFSLRMFGGLFYVQYLKYNFNTPLEGIWQEKLQVLQSKIPVEKTVALMESALIKVPMVMGYFKPMILLPIGIVNALDSEQIEAILAHELAHISRNDFLLNILQSVVEVLFYFNPAVWWISANIRMERENCCDDIAVSICGNSLTYAKALVSIQEMNQAAPSFAMTFSGQRQQNQLLNRVKRILHQPQNKSNIMEKFMATCLLLVAFVAWSLQANHSISPFEGNDTELFQETIVVTPHDDDVVVETVITQQDSIPKEKRHFHRNKGNEEIEMQLDGDEVIELKVNGKNIPEEDMDNYEDLVTELMEDLNNMKVPTPPSPPTPPTAPAAPTPPTAPGLEGVVIPTPPTPPSPPAPPSPPSFDSKHNRIIMKKDGSEETTIKIVKIAPDGEHLSFEDDEIEFSDFDFKIDDNLSDGLHILGDENITFAFEDLSGDELKDINLSEHRIMIKGGELMEGFDDNMIFLDTFPKGNLSPEEEKAYKEAAEARKEMQDKLLVLREKQREMTEAYRQEMSVRMKEFREKERAIQQELRAQRKDLMKERREIHIERSKAMRNDMRGRTNEMRAAAREKRRAVQKMEKSRRIHQEGSGNNVWVYSGDGAITTGDLRQLFEQQLITDGVIKNSGDAYSLELSGDKLSINGKKQSNAMLDKYKALYQSSTDSALKATDKISIKVKSSGSVSASIQIEDEE